MKLFWRIWLEPHSGQLMLVAINLALGHHSASSDPAESDYKIIKAPPPSPSAVVGKRCGKAVRCGVADAGRRQVFQEPLFGVGAVAVVRQSVQQPILYQNARRPLLCCTANQRLFRHAVRESAPASYLIGNAAITGMGPTAPRLRRNAGDFNGSVSFQAVAGVDSSASRNDGKIKPPDWKRYRI